MNIEQSPIPSEMMYNDYSIDGAFLALGLALGRAMHYDHDYEFRWDDAMLYL